MRKTNLLIVLTLVLSVPLAWALTSHTDYKTGMEVKECNACHKSNDVALTHGGLWAKEHRLYAEKYPNNCKDCHEQSFCMDCHFGGGIDADLHVANFGVDYMPKSHRTDWREIHPIKAQDDPRSCYRCHDAKLFCNQCHEKFAPNDLKLLSHRRGFSDIQVKAAGPKHAVFSTAQCPTCHPNSLVPTHQWSAGHAREARKNLTSCQTCHPDGDVCMKCHSAVTGLRVNPHPKNWDKIKGKLERASGNRTCIKCH